MESRESGEPVIVADPMVPITQSEILPEILLDKLLTEVRHGLHLLLGSLELAETEPLSTAQAEQLSRCREAAGKLLNTAADISELVSAGLDGESRSVFDLSQTLETFAEMIRSRTDKRVPDFQWSVDASMPALLLADPRIIESVLSRVVDNSINHTQEGGIVLSATSKALGPHEVEITLQVVDTRRSIPQDVLEELKKPISESAAQILGMRAVKKYLSRIGGELRVLSTTVWGTRLAIVFPAEIPPDRGGAQREDGSRQGTLGVLLAEDSDDSFHLFAAFVSEEGHRVTRVRDGAEAVEMYKARCFDIVVMDARMPLMDGYEATRRIREWEKEQGGARTPILLFSADCPRLQKRIGASVGCSGYLNKPASREELLTALRQHGLRRA